MPLIIMLIFLLVSCNQKGLSPFQFGVSNSMVDGEDVVGGDSGDVVDGTTEENVKGAVGCWECFSKAFYACTSNSVSSLERIATERGNNRDYKMASMASMVSGVCNLLHCLSECCVNTSSDVSDVVENHYGIDVSTQTDGAVKDSYTQTNFVVVDQPSFSKSTVSVQGEF